MKNIKSWSDIPKFTEEKGSVSEFELFKYFVGHIEDEIKEGLKLEPDFQRTHVWTMTLSISSFECGTPVVFNSIYHCNTCSLVANVLT